MLLKTSEIQFSPDQLYQKVQSRFSFLVYSACSLTILVPVYLVNRGYVKSRVNETVLLKKTSKQAFQSITAGSNKSVNFNSGTL